MPQVLRIGQYVVFFWSNENDPLEPVHVHIAENTPFAGATKVWITASGKALLANNNSNIPKNILTKLMKIIESNSAEIVTKWTDHFGEVSFYC